MLRAVAILRYAFETNDPWLAELVRRADTGESIADTIDFSQTPPTSEAQSNEEDADSNEVQARPSGGEADSNDRKAESNEGNVEALAELICRAGDEPGIKSAALLVLMAALGDSRHPRVVANTVKHLAFTRCGELNVSGMVETQIVLLESELLAGNTL
jgi:hypothetical protein